MRVEGKLEMPPHLTLSTPPTPTPSPVSSLAAAALARHRRMVYPFDLVSIGSMGFGPMLIT